MLEDLFSDAPEHIRQRLAELAAEAERESGGDLTKAADLFLRKLPDDESVRHPSIARLLRHAVNVSRASRKK